MNCKVMGIVNVTPDSFSDGGKYFTPEEAVRRIRNMVDEGADIIDIGAESTRPGAQALSWEEEWSRLEPVLQLLAKSPLAPRKGTVPTDPRGTVPISIDTYHPETAERALDLGADIINCVYEGTVPRMLEICAQKCGKLVIPVNSLGTVPQGMISGGGGTVPEGGGTVPGGVVAYIDPMIGFGTSREDDLTLLRSIPELAKRGPVLIGASRKRIVKKLTGEKLTGKNLGGNLGIAVWCAMKGASVVRVHDVKETVQALKVVAALESGVMED